MNENTINDEVTIDGGVAGMLLAGRYCVVRQLGQGGMGSVWLAEDTQLNDRRVAIKMLPSILVANKRAYNQLKAEALVSLKLTHTNIATVRAFEENGGNPFLVVDFIDGQTLDDYLAEKGTLTEDETIRLLAPVAAALDYAHSKDVVHRDVKPANVMIDKDGTPYVLDFGIAREIQETMTRVTGKLSSGTLLYMSPEQLHGVAPKASQDVYSFAAMAYECLTGAPPFSRGQIEYRIEHDAPAPLDPHIAISGSVMAGLAKDAAGRPASCAAVLQAQKNSSAANEARPETNRPPVADDARAETNRPRRSRTLRTAIWIVIVLAGLAGIGIAWDRLTWNERHRTAARTAFANKDWKTALDEAFKTDLTDPEIIFYIGCCYDNGRGVVKDEVEAVKWYRKAAEQGHAHAQHNLGVMYANGRGVAKDDAEAVKWYRKAAEQGDEYAQFGLGVMYDYGRGVAKDDAEAVKWYRKAAEQGDASAQFGLGVMYANGRGVTKDDTEAVKWYRKAVEQGHVHAQSNLGVMYEFGRGVAKDEAEAVKWYRKAAEQGNASAQYNLGLMYANGRGVAEDEAEAVKWYRKAAEQGDASAQCNLGWMYANGRGVTKDDTEAVKWYRKAVEQGHVHAQSNLGVMYEFGRGVAKDEAEAVKWYRKAAEQGDASAQCNLGWMYANGRGVVKDEAEAVKWYRKAVEQGHARAQSNLGWMYEFGRGVAKDEAEAVKWYRKAAEQGDEYAKKALERLGR